jgi:hypothetical protein
VKVVVAAVGTAPAGGTSTVQELLEVGVTVAVEVAIAIRSIVPVEAVGNLPLIRHAVVIGVGTWRAGGNRGEAADLSLVADVGAVIRTRISRHTVDREYVAFQVDRWVAGYATVATARYLVQVVGIRPAVAVPSPLALTHTKDSQREADVRASL